MKTTIELDDDLWKRFSILVLRELGERQKNRIIGELVRRYVEERGLEARGPKLDCILRIESEREAFLKIKESLLGDPGYRGKYVAILGGKVIGCDEDRSELARKVYKELGYAPIYFDKVAPGERVVEVPSPEVSSSEV